MAFPAVESDTANGTTGGAATNGDSAATSHSVVLPATVSPGSLLIVVGRCAGSGTVAFPAGWTVTQDSSDASDDVSFWAYKNTLAEGNEDGTSITVTHTNSNKMVAAAMSITGAANPASRSPQTSTVAIGTGSNPNPTTCTPTGGSKDYLWIAVGMADGEHTSPPGTIPSNYTASSGWSTGTAGAVGTNATLYTATRNNAVSSEDPGSWTTSVAVANGWTAWAIAVHPATNLFPASLTRTRAQGTPKIGINPAGLSRTRALGTPAPQRHHRARALGSPTLTAGTGISPASLTRTRAQGTPVTSPQLRPSAQAHTRAQGSPNVVITILPAAQAHTRAQGSPQVNPSIVPTGQVRSRAQGSVTVELDFQVSPAALVRTRAQGSPSVNPTLLPAAQSHTRAQGSPVATHIHRSRALGSLTVTTGSTVSPAAQTHSRAQGTPIVSPQLRPTGQARTRAQGSVTLGVFASPASLVRTRAQGTPVVSPKVLPAAQAHSRALGTTSILTGHRYRAIGSITVSEADIAANPASLVRTRALGSTAISSGHRFRQLGPLVVTMGILPPPALSHTRAQGSATVSTNLGGSVSTESLVRTRALGTTLVSAGHRVRALGALTVTGAATITVSPSGLTSTGSVPLLLGGPNRQRDLGGPAITLGEPGTASPASLVRTRALGPSSLTADAFIDINGIVQTRALGNTFIAPPGYHRQRGLGSLHVIATTATVSPSSLTSTGTSIPLLLGGPNRQRDLGSLTLELVEAGAPGSLEHTRTLGSPTLASGPLSLTHTRALGDPRTNVQIRMIGLEHTRFFGGATMSGQGVSTGNYNKALTGVGL